MHIPAFSEGQPAQFFNDIFADLESGLLCLNNNFEVEWATDNCAAMLGCKLDDLEGYGYNKVIPNLMQDLHDQLSHVFSVHENTVFIKSIGKHKYAFRCRKLGDGLSVIITAALPVPPMPDNVKEKLKAVRENIEEFKRGRYLNDD